MEHIESARSKLWSMLPRNQCGSFVYGWRQR